jgi:sugar/nucleoside kinase (ribokinase family)
VAWCVDRILTIDHWPQEETLAAILGEKHFGGCPGHNMASALKRLGADFPVEAMGVIGDDDDGRLLHGACDELGIDRRALKIAKGRQTAHALVMSSAATGKRTFFYTSGTHATQTPDDFDFTATTARIAHLGLPGLHDILDKPWRGETSGWVALLKKAQAAGLKCNMELASVAPETLRAAALPMLPYLDTLIINDYEVGALASMQTIDGEHTDISACRNAAAHVMAHSPLSFVAVHFPRGAIVATRGGEIFEQRSVKVPREAIAGSNGAGDSFAAGLLMGHHEGWPMPQSLKLAHASAAASLRSETTTGAVVHWKECLDLAESWGWS